MLDSTALDRQQGRAHATPEAAGAMESGWALGHSFLWKGNDL